MSKERKVIALGDYMKKIDSVKYVETPDGDIPIRIKRPSPEDGLVIMEMVNKEISGETIAEIQSTEELDVDKMSADERMELVRFSHRYDSTLISSCSFWPTFNGDGTVALKQEDNPKKIWEDAHAVMTGMDEILYKGLKRLIKGTGVAEEISAGEAKK
jgi:hypothetical protein